MQDIHFKEGETCNPRKMSLWSYEVNGNLEVTWTAGLQKVLTTPCK